VREKTPRQTNAAMSEATTRALVDAARRLFGVHGFAEAPIDDIVRPLGLTKGALYHHFGNKQGLFEAVVQSIDREVEAEIERVTAPMKHPLPRLLSGLRVYVEALSQPENLRILLLDAPAIFGLEISREFERDSIIQPLRQSLDELRATSGGLSLDAEVCAHFLHGSIVEAAFWVREQAEPEPALARVMDSLSQLLRGLFPGQ
jgi:AcrR family transcriptional regulator